MSDGKSSGVSDSGSRGSCGRISGGGGGSLGGN